MLDLDKLRKEFARYMLEENQRGSMDAGLFHVLKLAYKEGEAHGRLVCQKNVDKLLEKAKSKD